MPPSPTREFAITPPRPPRRKIPLLRIGLLGLGIWFLYHQFTVGWLARFWEKAAQTPETIEQPRPLSPSIQDSTWNGWCRNHGGQGFQLAGNLIQCSWSYASRDLLLNALQSENKTITNRLYYAADRLLLHFPVQLHWVARAEAFHTPIVLDMQSSGKSIRLIDVPTDSSGNSRWIDATTACAFPGPCPHDPLEGGAIPIPADFDFAGREYLLSRDQFRGIGESPVFPVLPGRVLSITKDVQGFSVELDHGDNLYSRSSGLASIYNGVAIHTRLGTETPIGRLSAQDTATFHLEILRNGKFVRWQDFWRESHPVPSELFATFRSTLGY